MTVHPPAPAPPVTTAQRAADGRRRRRAAPRSAHAELDLPSTRPDPLDVLAAQDRTRVPELLPIRYGRMAASPFAFFRGAAAIMAADLAGTPVSGLRVQLCGDAHLANFGVFASPERRLVFDVNDFDETLPGPFEWDVKRLAASVEVAGRDRGFDRRTRRAAVAGCVRAYREEMHRYAGMRTLDVWYDRADVDRLRAEHDPSLRRRQRHALDRAAAKARSRDHRGALARFTAVRDGRRRFVAAPPLVVPLPDLLPDAGTRAAVEAVLVRLLDGYRESLPPERRLLLDQYRLVDVAHKVVGVGSVGTRSWMLLLLGRDADDPLILQAKEAGPSVLEAHLGPAAEPTAGERVVTGQRIMQAVGDVLLGWQRSPGADGRDRDYYLRQLRDAKGSLEVEVMLPDGMARYAQLCGATLARAHARSGDRVAIASYLGSSTRFDRALAAFAAAYADRNECDHRLLLDAVAAGRVTAAAG